MMQEFEHLPDGFIALDQDQCVEFINIRAERILCCARQDVLQKSLSDALPALVDASFQADFQRAIAQHQELRFETDYSQSGIVLEVFVTARNDKTWMFLRDVTARKRSTEALQEYTSLFALSTAVSTAIQQSSHLDEMLHEVVNTLLSHLPSIGWSGLWIYDRESSILNAEAIASRLETPLNLPHRVSTSISIIGLIAQNQQAYVTNSLTRDICVGVQQSAKDNHLCSFAGFPLVVKERLVGVLACAGYHRFSDIVHDTLERIAQVVAIAIDRTMVRTELLSRRESLMFRLASQMRNSLDLDQILSTAVQEIHQLLQIDRCHFLWCWYGQDSAALDSHRLPMLAITHEAKPPNSVSVLGDCAPDISTILAEQILHLRVIRISCCDASTPEIENFRPVLAAWQVQTLLIVPLETRSGQLGAVVCSQCQGHRHWTQDEVDLLQTVTDQLAIAIEQAELYAQSKATARAAQTQAEQLHIALQTLQKAQTQLIHSEKMSSLGQLVAGIAHEINNPVNFISGNLLYAEEYFNDLGTLLQLYRQHYPNPVPAIRDRIQDVELDFLLEDFAHLLESMKIGSERICKIVLSLRNFSRLDEAEVKAVDIHDGIDSTLLILHNRLKPHGADPGIEVIKNYGQIPKINCYASQLNQVFMNLLGNAIDAFEDRLPPHQISITTTTCENGAIAHFHPTLDPSLTWVLIQIQDNGRGIPDYQIQKIFDPFFTTKPVGQGTGLGLSISYQIIVEKHHGWLGCTSNTGHGTTFTIALPLQSELHENDDVDTSLITVSNHH